ncbi:MAG: transposase [Desulfosalsimonadaceae bacterium]
MNTNNTFSLSLQKQVEQQRIIYDSEINKAFNELKIKSLLKRSGIVKEKGYPTISLVFIYVLVPFFKKKLSEYWNSKYIQNHIKAQKDVYYRFINCERFNWRKFIYFVALKIIHFCDDVPLSQKVLIADDTIAAKTGKEMELVSYHFDHKIHRTILGNQYLQLGYHNGVNFFPIDMAIKTSAKRPNKRTRAVDKRTSGWRRRTEALNKKTDTLIQMINRAWKSGIDAAFVLFDSWFAHDDVISKIIKSGYGVICRLKKGRVKYEYQGAVYSLKELWRQVARKKTTLIDKYQVKGACIDVSLPKTGPVRILFISDGKKEWHALLCTDMLLEGADILGYYARRWAIEIFFKDAKQMLCLGKEQSNTFDAAIACYSIMMLRYLLLVYLVSKRRIIGPLGPLFRQVSDDHLLLAFAEKIWAYVKELIIKSSQIICYKMEPDVILQMIEIVENNIVSQTRLSTAKL